MRMKKKMKEYDFSIGMRRFYDADSNFFREPISRKKIKKMIREEIAKALAEKNKSI